MNNGGATSSLPFKVLVTGAGGFIGSHIGMFLKARGYWVHHLDTAKPSSNETIGSSLLSEVATPHS